MLLIFLFYYRTRVVQKIVETVKRQEEIAIIVSALKHGVVTLIKNVNGNHVVQRCLQYLLPHCKKVMTFFTFILN